MSNWLHEGFSGLGWALPRQDWEPGLIWLHAAAGSLLSLAYFLLPLLLFRVVRQGRHLPWQRIFPLFSLFTVCSGLTHLMQVWALWHPADWVSGWLNLITALVVIYTIATLILPPALNLFSPLALTHLNPVLLRQIQSQEELERQILYLNERLRKQVDELERLNLLKDDFLSTISHELRTPLTNILLSIDLLQLSLSQLPMSEKQQQYLRLLRQECQWEIKLVEDLLMLQELSANFYSKDLEEVNLSEYLITWVQALQEEAIAAQQELSLEILTPLVHLQLEAKGFERILRELILNACKHGDRPGQIQVQVSLDTHSTSPNSLLVFHVRNKGSIPPAELPRLFDSFYRVTQADPWKQGGTGLGLALVKKWVESMQGQITVENEEGWVSFVVTLPVVANVTAG